MEETFPTSSVSIFVRLNGPFTQEAAAANISVIEYGREASVELQEIFMVFKNLKTKVSKCQL